MGFQGEQIAADYLTKQGYIILERNYRNTYGEIDIIAFQNAVIVFAEVKTRTSLRYGSPEEAVNKNKIKHIKNTAVGYLNEFDRSFKEIRFDVITICKQGEVYKINHIEAAF